MPKTQTLTIVKISDSLQLMETVDDQYLYTKHKAALRALLKDQPPAIHKITITRHRFGLYYTYECQCTFMPTYSISK